GRAHAANTGSRARPRGTSSTCAHSASTATPTLCCCWSTRPDPPATRTHRPASPEGPSVPTDPAELPIRPSLEQFRSLGAEHRLVPVHTQVLADSETPLSLYRKLTDGGPCSFLFESAVAGSWARYSFIGSAPVATSSRPPRASAGRGPRPWASPPTATSSRPSPPRSTSSPSM